MSVRGGRRRLLAVWALLAALVGVIVVVETVPRFAPRPAERTGRLPLFDFAEADLGAVEVRWEGRASNLVRDADGRWLRHDAGHRHATGDGSASHAADPQEAARITKALDVTARMLYDRRVTPDRALDAYGLVQPAVMAAFYGRSGAAPDYSRPLAVLYVGDELTTGFAYYAMLDGDRDIALVPRYQVALLLGLLFGEEDAPTLQPAR